jgi:hypothetical protein
VKLSEVVAKYIELRDRKAAIKGEYDAKVATLDQQLTHIEGKLLQVFDQLGMDSVRTEFGTAYKSERVTVSVADKDAFKQFCIDTGEFSLMEVRAAKTAVEQYKAANDGQLPPGLNWRAEHVVNFRRAS